MHVSWNSAWHSETAHPANKWLVYTASASGKLTVQGESKSFFSSQTSPPQGQEGTQVSLHSEHFYMQYFPETLHQELGSCKLVKDCFLKIQASQQIWWLTLVISAYGRPRKEGHHQFKAILGQTVNSCPAQTKSEFKNTHTHKQKKILKNPTSPEIRCECSEPFPNTEVFP